MGIEIIDLSRAIASAELRSSSFNIYTSRRCPAKMTADLIRSSTRDSQIGARLKRTNYVRGNLNLHFARGSPADKIAHTGRSERQMLLSGRPDIVPV